ncbi:hypothetical protein GK047_06985 [Paenibacillus sp. SYP-B3998]|uniref:DUF1871 family protein n=1 Tax=Paenibacillus sp. SYP-B3998 TaxID=2678564 RepID=A0A6G3ZUE6_9BACL|nr:hypothetical protein [Paenibacillus sp. SYP-B3998]NEW05762.1 hypothetical protein [Paenibacillus sp. SYP-B3998]
MKFRAVNEQTRMNYVLWSIKKEIMRENNYLNSLDYNPKPIIDVVKQQIDKWDPIELLGAHSPEDEYDGETQTLVIYITKHLADMNAEALGSKLIQIFQHSFGDEFDKEEEAIQVALYLIDALKTVNLLR